jgi:spermidine synthase
VSQQDGVRTLHFGSNYIQSQMLVEELNCLAFAYTRAMMVFETFVPLPREIALIGLGGGSIAKWCHRHHPKAKVTMVEINPHVIAVRDAFKIPQVDQRFRIVCEDGAKFVAESSTRFDVLLADCFTADCPPQELCSQEFLRSLQSRFDRLRLASGQPLREVPSTNSFSNKQHLWRTDLDLHRYRR